MRKMQCWAGLFMVAVLGAATVKGDTPPPPPPKIGIDLAFTTGGVLDDPGPAIGGTFHLGQHVALRPSVGYVRNQRHFAQLTLVYSGVPATPPNPEPPPPRTLTSEQWTGGLEALYYFKRTSDLSPYVFASYDVLRQSYPDATDLELEVLYLGAKQHQTFQSWRGGLGLQYAIKDKLALFGEIGLRYSSGDSQSQTSTFSSNVGVIFYVK